jgi:hypothetical protein
MQNNTQNNNKNAAKKSMRTQSQRLTLEPRIVFDAALPIARVAFIDAAHAVWGWRRHLQARYLCARAGFSLVILLLLHIISYYH